LHLCTPSSSWDPPQSSPRWFLVSVQPSSSEEIYYITIYGNRAVIGEVLNPLGFRV
jgi:hypothetical protein